MLLVIAILLMVILVSVNAGLYQMSQQTFVSTNTETYLTETAQEGAALYAACQNVSVGAGNYSPSDFNLGFSTTTPFGNSWGCVKTPGGVYGTLVTTVTFLSAPSFLPGVAGSNNVSSTTLQSNIAAEVAEDLTDRAGFSPNTLVGVVQANSTDLTLIAPYQGHVSLLTSGLSFATPAIVGNLYGTTSTNNVTNTPP